MTVDLMSSEESGEDDDKEVIIVHPLPWLSDKVASFKAQIDLQVKKDKTPQARRQMKDRVIGSMSTRPRPPDSTLPAWATVEL